MNTWESYYNLVGTLERVKGSDLMNNNSARRVGKMDRLNAKVVGATIFKLDKRAILETIHKEVDNNNFRGKDLPHMEGKILEAIQGSKCKNRGSY
uniref:Uncharacterized protein n=1 Tax=Solanum demissum TaxID=50514 RepID=Q0KII3_SOLDE|nr:hypothetical protein SDM1_58t00013 [Solanum demissum]